MGNEFVVRSRQQFTNEAIVENLTNSEDFILRHRGINHPFLHMFSKNETKEYNFSLFSEFYYFIRHLPFYIAGMAINTRDEKVLREIVVNVAEEVGEREKTPHLEIYRTFLSKIGITMDEINGYQCNKKTLQIDEGVRNLYTQCNIIEAMGAMFALETMSSKMVKLLNDGLKLQGLDAKTRLFFEIHIISEVGHSNGVYNSIGSYLTDEQNIILFNRGVERFMSLIEDFWDGVAEVCTPLAMEEYA